MPLYDYLLLDADGTLLDFDKAQRNAFFAMMNDMGYKADENVLLQYEAINAGYWTLLEHGEVTKDELVIKRFEDLFAHLALECDAEDANKKYIDYLGEGDFLLPGALETCAHLAQSCTLIIVTNGVANSQRRRIAKSQLAPYISHLIVSEDAGAAKPDKCFFDYTFQQCKIPGRDRVLMVGDSLAADIKGGFAYGLDTCWVNPKKQALPQGIQVTAVIPDISQLTLVVC